jgi:ribosomal-protein-alanine N-acetyltransferase
MKEIMRIEKKAFPKTPYDSYTFLYYAMLYPNTFLVYLEESSNKIRGYIIFRPDGYIISVAVDHQIRRKGIGNQLVSKVLTVSKGKARVEVRKSNKVAQMFYKKLGFKQINVIQNFYGDEDANVMIYNNGLDF